MSSMLSRTWVIGSLLIGMVAVAACDTSMSPTTPIDEPAAGQNGDEGGDQGSENEASPAVGEFAPTTNSIVSTDGGVRSDPEGVAPDTDVTRITWKDSRGADRTMTLGAYLYQYDFSFDDNVQEVKRSANDDAWGHEGFGYVVSHNTVNGNSPLGKANAPTKIDTHVFAGSHHAVHRIEMVYDRDKESGGMGIKIPVVIEWFVATGRDHPIWAVTWKMNEAANPNNVSFDTYRMDTRGPYGSLNFDGAASRNQGDAIGGVAWGDFGYKFTTTSEPLTMNSTWDYSSANLVNFCRAWTETVNAEMGIVQTTTPDVQMGYPERVETAERGKTSAQMQPACAGDARDYLMPCVSGWPYQLMNYDWDPGTPKPLDEATGTKLVAWGSPYGYLGASSFDLFGNTNPPSGDGRGDRSYAMFIVLGPKNRFDANTGMYTADGDVAQVLSAVQALTSATLVDIAPGSVVTELPTGVGATQTKKLTNGYYDAYAANYLRADANQVAFTYVPRAGVPVTNPIFVVQNYTADTLPTIHIDGKEISVNDGTAKSGAFVSLNPETDELWVTINRTVAAAMRVEINP